MKENDGCRKTNRSPEKGTAQQILIRMLVLGVILTAALAAGGAGSLAVRAETGSSSASTRVIRTTSEDAFAEETAKLARQNRGLTVQSNGKIRPYASARLIVRVKDGNHVDFSPYGASTVVESNFGVSIVQFSSSDKAKKAKKKIAALSSVSYVEADDCTLNTGDYQLEGGSPSEETLGTGEADIIDLGAASDRIYGGAVSTEGLSVSSAGMSWGSAYIQADKFAAYVKANSNRTVKVAVVDSGVSSHTKLSGRILKGRDFVDNDSNPADKNGHGTHVAGVIVDCTPGINVKILPVRVMNGAGYGSPSVVGNGIRYAVNNGAKVINLSLGGYDHYRYVEECVTYAHKKGVTVVAAAGNESDSTYYVCPAHMSTPIVVGAINNQGKRAWFSNFGSSLDIMAPGVSIKSCWLNGKYATASGTSMAAPHISAAAAMYWIMHPTATPSKIEYYVRCYAKDLGSKGTDKYYGRGVPRMAGSITPSKVTLSKTKASVQLKKTLTLKASISPAYAGKNKLTWTSSNNNVVSVSSGRLTAKKKGTATITVKTVNGKKATCRVTVTAAASTASKNAALTTMSRSESAAKAAPYAKGAAPAQNHAETPGAAAAKDAAGTDGSAVQTPAQEDGPALQGAGGDNTAAGPVKVYIYPSETAGNTPVQDGSIVAGSRLALEVETVPALDTGAETGPALLWTSSAPEVASVDEKGLVTANAPGQAQITAEIEAPGTSAATGTFMVTVVRPSILTRNATYDAGAEDRLQIQTVLRLPGTLEKAEDSSPQESADQSRIVALLREEGEDHVLLGAMHLGGEDSGLLHVHASEDDRVLTDVRKTGYAAGLDRSGADGAAALTDAGAGKAKDETGILSAGEIRLDGGKADLELTADLGALRAAMPSPAEPEETVWTCRLAVYTPEAFENREAAVKEGKTEEVRAADSEALCSTGFTMKFTRPADSSLQPDQGADAVRPETDQEAGGGKSGDSSGGTDDTKKTENENLQEETGEELPADDPEKTDSPDQDPADTKQEEADPSAEDTSRTSDTGDTGDEPENGEVREEEPAPADTQEEPAGTEAGLPESADRPGEGEGHGEEIRALSTDQSDAGASQNLQSPASMDAETETAAESRTETAE